MNVLHVAYVGGDPCSGVDVAVPKHILSQQEFENVAFVNIADVSVEGVRHQFPYHTGFTVKALPQPFCHPDIVIFHEVYRPPFLKIAKELRKLGVPYIIVPHGCLTRAAQHKKFLKKKLGNAMFFYDFIRHAVAIQCLSEQERVSTAYGDEKFIGVNGMNMPDTRKTTFRTDNIELLYIGRFELLHKGLDLLVQAVARERELFSKNGAVLRMYGPDVDGQYEAVDNLIKTYQTEDLIVLNGPILGEDKKNALLNADLFIQTSRTEGMPMGVLEALSYGVPCLLTQGTGIGKKVADAQAGWSCETAVDAIACMMRDALEHKETWADRSENAVRFIEREFELSQVAAQTLRAYRQYIR